MVSELKEQQQRFEEIMSALPNYPCDKCPANDVCHSENTTTEDVHYTCEETLWHYIKTGEILI